MADIYPNDYKYFKNTKWKVNNEKMDGYDLAVNNILFTRFRINKKSINYLCKSQTSFLYIPYYHEPINLVVKL